MSPIVRFAPSPTGFMHIGNARIAIVNYLFCKKNKGQYILRIDDTDKTRSKLEFEQAIKQDLHWLGINPDSSFKQSEKLEKYYAVKDKLIVDGVLYKCYETEEELEFKRSRAFSQGKPPVYDRASLYMSADACAKFEKEGRRPYWRFKLPDQIVCWDDLILGHIEYDLKNISDPVVIKSDGTFLYSFCSVVDDIDSNITHIIRGQDHVTNTAAQVAMFQIISQNSDLGVTFAHLSLLIGKDGAQFSKRDGNLGIAEYREAGIDPMSILNLMATLGSSQNVKPFTNLDDLVEYFDISTFGKNSPKFDPDDVFKINKKIILNYTFAEAQSKVGFNLREDIFNLFKDNVTTLADMQRYISICSPEFKNDIAFSDDDVAFLVMAANLLPHDFDEATYKQWISQLSKETGRSGKDLYAPIRRAITSEDHGPNLLDIMKLIGINECRKRLSESQSSSS